MLAAQLLEPARRLGGPLEVEAAGIENPLQRHLAHAHRHNLSMAVEPTQNRQKLFTLSAGDQVDLAEQNHIGELHLLDKQIGDRALVLFTESFTTAGQAFGGMEVLQEVHPVDHRDHGVEARNVGQALAVFTTEGEGFRHRQWLGNTRRLDQQVIETPVTGQTPDLLQQVLTQGAADAAVAHFHQLFFAAVEADIALHFAAIDVDFTHVIDDYRDLEAFAVTQNVIEHGAFAGTEKAGEHGDGKTSRHGPFLFEWGGL